MRNTAIKKSKMVASPIENIWWKWTTHEGLLTFFGADNMIELTPGGPFEIYFLMDAPVGSRGSEGCKILSFLPEKMLSFSWNAPPQYPSVRNDEYKTWVVVDFKALEDHKTEITLHHLGWKQGEEWEAVYAYFDKAWERVLEWLEESCKNV